MNWWQLTLVVYMVAKALLCRAAGVNFNVVGCDCRHTHSYQLKRAQILCKPQASQYGGDAAVRAHRAVTGGLCQCVDEAAASHRGNLPALFVAM